MSVICSNSIVEKLPKLSYSEHHDKIIKAIHYKITPLNMSPKAKRVIQRQKLTKRPTFNEYSYFRDKSFHSFDKQNQSHKSFIVQKNQFSIQNETQQIKRNLNKSFTYVSLKHKNSQKSDTSQQIQKLTIDRLPSIRKEISNQKEQLAKSLQKQSIVFQKDNLKENQDKIYNLEYILNRLTAYQERNQSRRIQQKIQPIRGYENLSPNKLNQYIQYFKKKKNPTQSIYTSKKRIPLPRSSTQINQKQMKQQLKRLQTMVNIKSQKKINSTKSKKELSTTKKIINFQAFSKKQIKKSVQKKK